MADLEIFGGGVHCEGYVMTLCPGTSYCSYPIHVRPYRIHCINLIDIKYVKHICYKLVITITLINFLLFDDNKDLYIHVGGVRQPLPSPICSDE